jgi:hypothetical protein
MNIDKDTDLGKGATLMEFNIGHVENLNPNLTSVVNHYNYYGTRAKSQPETEVNKEALRQDILQYVGNTLRFVNRAWKDKYMALWADILLLPAVDAIIFDRGLQEGTRFNRKEVAHIICYLGKYADGGYGIFERYVAKHIALCFKDGKETAIRPELGFRPSKEIQHAIDKLMNEKYM